jgi:protein TonB
MVTTNAVRFPFANLLALALMACLFAVLFNVITYHRVVGDPKPVVTINFTPLIHDTPVQTRPPKPIPPTVEPRPTTPPITQVVPGPGNGIPPPTVGPVDPPPLPRGVINRLATPMVRLEPEYPHRAIAAHIEGWVELQFTITAAGTVTDIAVVGADPAGVFEDAATKALQRWKYAPSLDDGRAVERRGNRVVLRFNMP